MRRSEILNGNSECQNSMVQRQKSNEVDTLSPDESICWDNHTNTTVSDNGSA
jgi:hypothetical protein